MRADVGIVGAGLAGLTCAIDLQQHGISVLVFEKSNTAGGRVVTDVVDGFILDRGFQVFLSSYPFARSALNLKKLNLKSFDAGALIWDGSCLKNFRNPVQHPAATLDLLTGKVATLPDVLSMARFSIGFGSVSFAREQYTGIQTEEFFASNFSNSFVTSFLRPFFQGVFLQQKLTTDSGFCRFLLPLFFKGRATLPAEGMQAIPQQLAGRLPEGALRYGSAVTEVTRDYITLSDGMTHNFAQTVIATDPWSSHGLLTGKSEICPRARGTQCYYFAIEGEAPIKDAVLFLNGSGFGVVNSFCFPSNVAQSYAPEGMSLCSVSVLPGLDHEPDAADVRDEVGTILQVDTGKWRLLKRYAIAHSLPEMPGLESVDEEKGVLLAGDYLVHPSIEGAMRSGYDVAQRIKATLSR